MDTVFADRAEAGRRLAAALEDLQGADAIVLALPRGGVAVGREVALALRLPLDVLITRKIGAPFNPEYAIGALCEVGDVLLNEREIAASGVSPAYLTREVERQRAEIRRQAGIFRGQRGLPPLQGRTVILVDDGIATGYTMFAGVRGLRALGPARIVVAIPVAPPSTAASLTHEAERVACIVTPDPFYAVGNWYRDFAQLSDDDVRDLLRTTSQGHLDQTA